MNSETSSVSSQCLDRTEFCSFLPDRCQKKTPTAQENNVAAITTVGLIPGVIAIPILLLMIVQIP